MKELMIFTGALRRDDDRHGHERADFRGQRECQLLLPGRENSQRTTRSKQADHDRTGTLPIPATSTWRPTVRFECDETSASYASASYVDAGVTLSVMV